MLGKRKKKNQIELFRSRLDNMISTRHELVVLSGEIDWNWIEKELSTFYSDQGRPSVPIRTIVGMLLLKQLFNESDESVLHRWIENPYWQYFTGETYFQHQAPFDPTDFVYFRKRIGKQGMEKVLSLTVKLHPGSEKEKIVEVDTTVQEKNITYPTDAKLQEKIMDYLRWIAEMESLPLRQSYRFVQKKLRLQMHNGHHPKRRKQANKARRKLKTICGRLLRDVERKLHPKQLEHYRGWLNLYKQVLHQKRNDKQKIYSLHELEVACIAKGKAHKKYEFGCKVAVARTGKSGVIVGMTSFNQNIYDGHTLGETLAQCERIRKDIGGNRPKVAVADRGFRGKKEVDSTTILTPNRGNNNQTQYQKRKLRKLFRSRAGIEAVIGHLKHDHRMLRNYLSGVSGDAVNALLAGAAFNLKKRLNQIKKSFWNIIYSILKSLYIPLRFQFI